MKPTFRQATLADLEDLYAIECAAFSSPWDEDMLRDELQVSHSCYRVMVLDGAVVGYYGYMHILDEAHILNVAVLPAYQGRGLGRLLMQDLLSTLPRDVVAATLEVRVGNLRARRLYESLGFVEAGTRPGYYLDKEDAVIYWWTKGD